jgi:hypothetical protein
VVVDVGFDMKFTYVLARWEGSAQDATIFADSMNILDSLKILEDTCYIGYVRYAFRPKILLPFRSTRYHLSEFSAKFFPKQCQRTFQSQTLKTLSDD